jgi:hypothetical protein
MKVLSEVSSRSRRSLGDLFEYLPLARVPMLFGENSVVSGTGTLANSFSSGLCNLSAE